MPPEPSIKPLIKPLTPNGVKPKELALSEEVPINDDLPVNKSSPKQQSQKDKTALLPESDYAKSLFEQTNIERQARGYNNVKYFPSLACKRKFEARCQYLNGNTANAIKRAHEKGIIAITGIVDFIAKYEPNGANKTNGQSHQSPSGNRKPKTAKHSPKTWTQRRAEARSGS